MKTFQRILAIALALIMSLSVLGTVAFADEDDSTPSATIDTTKTGSITIHKYEAEGGSGNGDGSNLGDNAPTADGLKGVTFTIYKVMNADEVVAYYNGTNTPAVAVSNYVTDGAINDDYSVFATQTTDENGVAKFEGLEVGMYVVIETDYPDKVTDPAEPFLVSIPMTNPSNETAWMYDVHVYPKNSTSVGGVKLVKYGEENALLDATFALYKIEGSTETDKGTYTTTNGEVTISDLEHGYYKLVETATAEGYIVNATPIYFTVNQNNTVTYDSANTQHQKVVPSNNNSAILTLTITNEKPDVTKTASATNAAVGQNVDFTVTVEVPTNITVLSQFVLKDAPTNLHVDTNTVKVYDNTTEVTGIGSAEAQDDGFVLTFTPANMSAYAGKTLTVKYTAKVLASAATAGEAINEVTLTYEDSVKMQTAEAAAALKNYKISIVKYKDSVADANKIGGVEFKLYDANDNVVKATKTGDVYVVDASGSETLTTDANGKIVISGLAEGTYYLKETKTIDGYNLLSGVIEIDLNTTNAADYSFEQTIVNKKGFNLPETGGIGTLMFIIIGGVLVAGGICLITVPGKKRSV